MGSVIVTGANGGIGSAVVTQLLAEGKHVSAVVRNIDKLRDNGECQCCEDDKNIVVQKTAFTEHENCFLYDCDFSDEKSIAGLVKRIVAEHGAMEGFVHCAGFDKLSPLYLNKTADIEKLFQIHVFAPITFCKYLAKKGNAAEGCSVVLISSLSAHEGASGHTVYAAAKGALEGFLPSAASEMAGKGIRINAVVPGIVRTGMSESWMNKLDERQAADLDQSYPLGIGKPEDVAETICFLLSEKSRWMTGQKVVLDGGHMCRRV